MRTWNFLTSHARVLPCLARDPVARLCDAAASRGHHRAQRPRHRHRPDRRRVPRQAQDGRRNRYQIQAHLLPPEPASKEPASGDILPLLAGDSPPQ